MSATQRLAFNMSQQLTKVKQNIIEEGKKFDNDEDDMELYIKTMKDNFDD